MGKVYHFTSVLHAKEIIRMGKILLSPSNIIEPIDAKRGISPFNGSSTIVSAVSDMVKPVVWLTDAPNENLGQLGLGQTKDGSDKDKSVARITIEHRDDYYWWHTWSNQNKMKQSWKKRFIRNMNYGSWYVCEHEIDLKDIEIIENLKTGEIYWKNENLK